ncbi:hypothetical protein MN0502_35010 (plasmid) [Arthrobacter sp. MN05-02]|nr:hypothetical protein MN0502_35010 [Arthrobacter sp. MN05-02]
MAAGWFWVASDGEQRTQWPQRYAYEHLIGEAVPPASLLCTSATFFEASQAELDEDAAVGLRQWQHSQY